MAPRLRMASGRGLGFLRLSIQGTRGLLLAAATAAALWLPEPARAIVLNDNFDGSTFTVIDAASTPGVAHGIDTANLFNNVASLDKGDCTGTLVNSRTILTAAHCFFDSKTNQSTSISTVGFTPAGSSVATRTVSVALAIIHPQYSPATSSAADIALLILSTPITDITPVNLLTLTPGSPGFPGKGTPIVLAGFGNYGTGSDPPTSSGPNDNKRRAVQTTLGGYVSLNSIPVPNGGNQNGFAAQFRDPANPTTYNFFNFTPTQAQVTDAEGGTAPGDSGGPVFYCPLTGNTGCTPSQLVQIGDLIGGGQPSSGGGPLTYGYGDVSGWTPINLFLSWVNSNSGTQAISAQAGTSNWSAPSAWSGGIVPGSSKIAWLDRATTMTVDTNPTVSALWLSDAQAVLSIGTSRTLAATTDTVISNGRLSVMGTLTTPLLELSGGSLIGSGTIATSGGYVSNYAGTIMPGTTTATGTLTVQGNYLQTPSGTLAIKAGATTADKLNVTGNADIDGSIFQAGLIAQGTPIVGGTSYNVLSSAALSNRFATVSRRDSSAFIGVNTAYSATGVSITLNRIATYASVATTDNGYEFAVTLDKGLRKGKLSADMKNILSRLDIASAADADDFYTRGAGDGADDDSDVVGNQLTANLATARMIQGALDQHLAGLRDDTAWIVQNAAGLRQLNFAYGPGTGFGIASDSNSGGAEPVAAQSRGESDRAAYAALEPKTAAWLRVIGGWNTLKSDDNAFGLKQNTAGLIGGLDANPFGDALPDLKSGASFSYTRSNLGGGSETGTTDTYRLSVYGTHLFAAAYVDGHLTYGWGNMSSSRHLEVLGLDRTAVGSTRGSEWAASLNAGYRKMFGRLLVEPSLGASYIRVTRAGFDESEAGALNLMIEDSSLQSMRYAVGLRTQMAFNFADGLLLRPEMRARYSYEALDTMPTTTAAIEGLPADPFAFDGVRVGRHIGSLGGGVTLVKTNSLALFADYNVEWRERETTQTAWGGLRVRW